MMRNLPLPSLGNNSSVLPYSHCTSPKKNTGAERQESTTVPTHPLGVKPLGNAYTAKLNIRTRAGELALLPDELIIQILEWLEINDLLRLGSTCKALYAFSREEELWKTLFLR